jgi:hypothetical protein
VVWGVVVIAIILVRIYIDELSIDKEMDERRYRRDAGMDVTVRRRVRIRIGRVEEC